VAFSQKRLRLLLLGLSCLAPAASHAAVFKSVDATGGTIYQQRPCPDAGTPSASAKAPDAAAAGAPKMAIGMSADEVRRLWGPPDQIGKPGAKAPEDTEQWIYPHPPGESKSVAITLQHGHVLRWAALEGGAVPARTK
jgi:hypothetical protein